MINSLQFQQRTNLHMPVIIIFPNILIWLPEVNAYCNSEFTMIVLALRELENNKQLSLTLSNDFKYVLL